ESGKPLRAAHVDIPADSGAVGYALIFVSAEAGTAKAFGQDVQYRAEDSLRVSLPTDVDPTRFKGMLTHGNRGDAFVVCRNDGGQRYINILRKPGADAPSGCQKVTVNMQLKGRH